MSGNPASDYAGNGGKMDKTERTYIGLVHKDPDSDYGVSFPDLPGCITADSTLEAVKVMAAEALGLHLEGMTAYGEYIPPASSADAILAHEDASDAIAFIVVVGDPPRTEEEAQAAFDAFMASEYGQEFMRDIALDRAADEMETEVAVGAPSEVAVAAETPEREPALAR